MQQAKLRGLSLKVTARDPGIHRNTVRKYALAESPPLRNIKSAARAPQPETGTPALTDILAGQQHRSPGGGPSRAASWRRMGGRTLGPGCLNLPGGWDASGRPGSGGHPRPKTQGINCDETTNSEFPKGMKFIGSQDKIAFKLLYFRC